MIPKKLKIESHLINQEKRKIEYIPQNYKIELVQKWPRKENPLQTINIDK